MCASRRGQYVVMGNVGTRSSLLIDFDDDGDLDIVTGEFNDRPQVLVSNLSERADIRFLKVRLIGTRSNRDGLGARVTVEAGGGSFTETHDGKSGYLSQSSLPLYFGLGGADTVERVIVEWPSGERQEVTEGLEISSIIEITEP